VHTGSGIERPGQLAGRTVGVAEYQLTANMWIRGILAEHYGVPVNSVRYRTGGLHEPGRPEKLAVTLPSDIGIAPIGPGETLSDLLASGGIDALYTPRTPRSFAAGHPKVTRLFPDFRAVESAYWRQTGIFPIMHVVVIRADVYRQDRWVARSLMEAFTQARQIALTGLTETASLRYMLPWLPDDVAYVQRCSATTTGPTGWTGTKRRCPRSPATPTSRDSRRGSTRRETCSSPRCSRTRSSDRTLRCDTWDRGLRRAA
jgi:4,5-dihydroxyphthalate decarboxylase